MRASRTRYHSSLRTDFIIQLKDPIDCKIHTAGGASPMVQLTQAKPTLSQRNWQGNRIKKSKPLPWYPFVVVVLVLQIGAILFLNKDVAVEQAPPKDKPLIRNSRRAAAGPAAAPSRVSLATARQQEDGEDSRPDGHLPANVKLRSLEEMIRAKLGVQRVKSCVWHRKNALGKMRVVPDDDCEGRELVFYNPLNRDRRVCIDCTVPAGGLARAKCDDARSRLFPATPALEDAHQFPAIYVGMDVDAEEWQVTREEGEYFHCDVPCQKNVEEALVADFFIGDTNWRIRYSMESAGYYPMTEVNPMAHGQQLFYATTSFKSEIPLPYFNWDEYSIQTPAVEFDKVIKGASFIATNCESLNGREQVVRDLHKIIRVDSIGSCLHNAKPPPGTHADSKKSMMQQYMFHLAFENYNENDYVTEKLWSTLEAGTLPVYLGALNVKEHAPPNSIIHVHDFASGEALGKYLLEVANNKTLYESYHEWRNKPLPQWFHEKYDFTHTHSICRICRWAHARLYGYAFDHENQTIRDPIIPRRICWDPTTRLLTHPLREQWMRSGEVLRSAAAAAAGGREGATCQTRGMEQTVQVGTWKRTISNWDGVVDIDIEGTGEDGVYQLTIPFANYRIRQRGSRQWQIQDSKSRITLLTSWDAIVFRQQEASMIGIEMRGQKKMKLRLVVEEIEHFYEDGGISSTYFGDLMVKDFQKPMERFLIMDE